jgi:hypothetical protein
VMSVLNAHCLEAVVSCSGLGFHSVEDNRAPAV